MKKYILTAACAAMMLASCTSDTIAPSQEQKEQLPISFTAYSRGLTRGMVMDYDYLKEHGFRFHAVSNGQFLTGTESDGSVTTVSTNYDANSDRFVLDNPIYWPAADMSGNPVAVDFYALCAQEAMSPQVVNGEAVQELGIYDPQFDYDFLVATAKGQVASGNGSVALTFKHLPASMTMTVKSEDDKYYYTVYGISIDYSKIAHYNFNTESLVVSTDADAQDTYELLGAGSNGLLVDNAGYAFGSAAPTSRYMFFWPGTYTVKVSYAVNQKVLDATGNPIVGDRLADYTGTATKSAQVTLTGGQITNLTLTLPSGVTGVGVDTSVKAWQDGPGSNPTIGQ